MSSNQKNTQQNIQQNKLLVDNSLKNELRKYNKRDREIQRLKPKPYDQLNQDQKNKLETEDDVKDHIRYLETLIKEQNAPKSVTPPVSNKPKRRNKSKKGKKTKVTKKMTEADRKAYNKHKLRSKIQRLQEKQEQRSRIMKIRQLRLERQTYDQNIGWVHTLITMMNQQNNKVVTQTS